MALFYWCKYIYVCKVIKQIITMKNNYGWIKACKYILFFLTFSFCLTLYVYQFIYFVSKRIVDLCIIHMLSLLKLRWPTVLKRVLAENLNYSSFFFSPSPLSVFLWYVFVRSDLLTLKNVWLWIADNLMSKTISNINLKQ